MKENEGGKALTASLLTFQTLFLEPFERLGLEEVHALKEISLYLADKILGFINALI